LFKKSEDYHLGASQFHGAGGEWRVEKQRLRWDILDAFRDAAAENGIPKVEDFNRGDNEGCGYFDVNQKRGVRWNASKAFLRPAMKDGNLTIMTGSHVSRLRMEQGEQGRSAPASNSPAVAAPGLPKPGNHPVRGAIGSPHILQMSGIADPALLQQHQIPVVHALPGVGENLQDHLQMRMVFKVDGARTLNAMASTWSAR
jgi:choline dehydrogenase